MDSLHYHVLKILHIKNTNQGNAPV